MKLHVEALVAREPRAIADLLRLCTHCARIGASKVGAQEFSDDIAQEIVLFVLDRFLAQYDGERDVEPYLIEAGRRMGLSYYRKHSREIHVGSQEEGLDPLLQLQDQDMIAEERMLQAEIEQRAASARAVLLSRIRAKAALPQRGVAPAPAARVEASPARQKGIAPDDATTAVRKARAERPEVRELVQLRKRIGLTQEEMALSLGMSENSIRSLEYGVVASDPQAILLKARVLESRHQMPIDAQDSGAELIRHWCKRLGLKDDDHVELARQIGIHRSTAYRWSQEKTQPPPHQVRKLNAIVETLIETVR